MMIYKRIDYKMMQNIEIYNIYIYIITIEI